jgi:RNA polymerase sigma factor (sigma-70 family)
MQVTARRCFHWKQHQRRFVSSEDAPGPEPTATAALPEELLREVETEQQLRDELQRLTTRCRQLIEMLFFEEPARPYSEVAASLGIATGSIGFIRGRCLEKLRARLEEIGFK